MERHVFNLWLRSQRNRICGTRNMMSMQMSCALSGPTLNSCSGFRALHYSIIVLADVSSALPRKALLFIKQQCNAHISGTLVVGVHPHLQYVVRAHGVSRSFHDPVSSGGSVWFCFVASIDESSSGQVSRYPLNLKKWSLSFGVTSSM